jgi:phosphoribosylformylglycinamidine (FGAM) synthase-like enzyme
MKKTLTLAALLTVSLFGCDVFESSKAQIEQQYLSENQELKAAIDAIREQGLQTVATSAESGSVAACVTKNLKSDPMGALIEVESVLQDSAGLEGLVETINSLTEQELSLETIGKLIQHGAEKAEYLKTLLSQYELSELQTQLTHLLEQGQKKSQDIGQHLRELIEICK